MKKVIKLSPLCNSLIVGGIQTRTDYRVCQFSEERNIMFSLYGNASSCEYLMVAEVSLVYEEVGGPSFSNSLLCMQEDSVLSLHSSQTHLKSSMSRQYLHYSFDPLSTDFFPPKPGRCSTENPAAISLRLTAPATV